MKVFGLIGKLLGHSFSQRWFTELFAKEGLEQHRYDLMPLEEVEDFPGLLHGTPGLAGLNVTIPYKQSIIPFLDELDPLAAAVGAVNTVSINNGRTTGHNTDVEGFRSTLLPLLKGGKPRALVLGTGGASRAVAFVLREQGIKFRMVSRSAEHGDLTWDMLDPIVVKVCTLIVNTTPLGMHPDVGSAPPLPYEAIGPKHILIDLVYNPMETRFMQLGKDRGATVVNGMSMLEAQAKAAWRIWNAA